MSTTNMLYFTFEGLCTMHIYIYIYILISYVIVKNNTPHFAESESPNTFLETDIIRMVEICFIDNIYVEFGGHVYQQTVGIPMGTNCAPLVADSFLYSNEHLYNIYKRVSSRNKNIL